MKIAFALIILALAGCTSTSIKTPDYEIHRVSVLQKVAFTVDVLPGGGMRIQYGNDGGQNVAAGAAKAAAMAIVQ